jgi:hypothetical protein
MSRLPLLEIVTRLREFCGKSDRWSFATADHDSDKSRTRAILELA